METLKHEAWQSLVETQFWTKLAKVKLDDMHLSEAPVPITGASCRDSRPPAERWAQFERWDAHHCVALSRDVHSTVAYASVMPTRETEAPCVSSPEHHKSISAPARSHRLLPVIPAKRARLAPLARRQLPRVCARPAIPPSLPLSPVPFRSILTLLFQLIDTQDRGAEHPGRSCAPGTLFVVNTVERFKALDRDGAVAAAAGAAAGDALWGCTVGMPLCCAVIPAPPHPLRSVTLSASDLRRSNPIRSAPLRPLPSERLVAAIASGAAAADPAALSPFLLVCFPDLKQYSFLYWRVRRSAGKICWTGSKDTR